jgi:uncharacterized protein with PIN domain
LSRDPRPALSRAVRARRMDRAGGSAAARPRQLPALSSAGRARRGNAIAGVRLPLVEVPRATYVGWNPQVGAEAPQALCTQSGGLVPLAETRAARQTSGDPRPSLEELYPDAEAYVSAVRVATEQMFAERLLLPADANAAVAAAGAGRLSQLSPLRALASGLRASRHDALLAEVRMPEAALFAVARTDGALLLTRDRRLASTAGVEVFLIEADVPEEQAAELARSYPFDWLRAPLTRCLVDNATLRPATSKEIGRAPAFARDLAGPFTIRGVHQLCRGSLLRSARRPIKRTAAPVSADGPASPSAHRVPRYVPHA